MVLSVEEAKTKVCLCQNAADPRRPMIVRVPCAADQCMTYWRWADVEHTKGYCALTGKPEF